MSNLWQHAISPGTRSAYMTGFHVYLQFLLMNAIVSCITADYIPVSEDLLIYFVAHCATNLNISYASIKLYLCGIRFVCLERNLYYPAIHELDRLKAILNGVKRSRPGRSTPRYPITFHILRDICLWLRNSVLFDNVLLETVCVVAFFGFLRCGEFTVKSSFDPSIHLCVNDLIIMQDYVQLHLKVSKTDPFRQGVQIKLFKNEHGLCPFDACCRYMKIRMLKNPLPHNALFVTNDGSALTRTSFISMFKHALSSCGYDATLYNGHSFRKGAASSAASGQVQDHLIKVLGRWSSDSYCRYISTSDHTLRNAQLSMTHSVS